MPDSRQSRSQRRAARLRRQRRRRTLRIAVLVLAAVAVLAALLFLILKPRAAGPDAPAPGGMVETAGADPAGTPTDGPASPAPSPSPTPEPTAAPTLTPRPTPEGMPDVVSFYRPKGKSYSPRVRMGDTIAARWKKGEDIGSFEVIASDAAELPGDFFGDIFGKAWKAFPASGQCKIGYTLRYTLDDGSEIKYTMLSPQHIEHTEYIECWLYDDYHREPHTFYSHIKKMKPDTLMTSIKLTCGSRIAHVQDIWLTAFICSSLDDFDADRNYIGDVSRTIHITRK